MKHLFSHKGNVLFVVLGAVFLTNALLAEFIGVKIFSLEKTLGWPLFSFSLFGRENLSFNLTAGVLLWPVVFVLTDIINEYYGRKGVRFLSWLAAILIAYAFLMCFLAIRLVPADFWPTSHYTKSVLGVSPELMPGTVGNLNVAYALIFGQGLWIIIGSLIAFLFGQLIDVMVFQRIKRLTGERSIWLRSTGSTLVSQFIDSFVVLFIAFYIGADWDIRLVLAIGLVNYLYKFSMAVLLTPVIYLIHGGIERYLGHDLAARMKEEALLTGQVI